MNKIYLVLLSALVLGISLATYAVNRNKLASIAVQDEYPNETPTKHWVREYKVKDQSIAERKPFDACYSNPPDNQIYCSITESPYENDNIHKWACDTAIEYDESHGGKTMGCHDICWTLGGGKKLKDGSYSEVNSISFEEYPERLVNACAIVLNGAEW